MTGAMATRLAGSSDLYEHAGRAPFCSINFITSHDGFTLNDLVSYKDKHNEANGEGNRDGDNHNCSDNYGVEGPSRKKSIEQLRTRQIKNMLATLLLSQGVPMLVMGDECRRTQRGNNNAYCQDNEISWFNWGLIKRNEGLLDFVRGAIQIRRSQPTLRRTRFLAGNPRDHRGVPDVAWFNTHGHPLNWDQTDGSLMVWLTAPPLQDDPKGEGRDFLIMLNGSHDPKTFMIPEHLRGLKLHLAIDTAADSPNDIYPDFNGPALISRHVDLIFKSVKVFVSAKT